MQNWETWSISPPSYGHQIQNLGRGEKERERGARAREKKLWAGKKPKRLMRGVKSPRRKRKPYGDNGSPEEGSRAQVQYANESEKKGVNR